MKNGSFKKKLVSTRIVNCLLFFSQNWLLNTLLPLCVLVALLVALWQFYLISGDRAFLAAAGTSIILSGTFVHFRKVTLYKIIDMASLPYQEIDGRWMIIDGQSGMAWPVDENAALANNQAFIDGFNDKIAQVILPEVCIAVGTLISGFVILNW